jgi:hypothetical protein
MHVVHWNLARTAPELCTAFQSDESVSHHTGPEEDFALPKGALVTTTFAYISKNTRAEGQDTILPLPSNT